MKLMMCAVCRDVVGLTKRRRRCRCKAMSGRYLADGLHAEVAGDGIVIGIDSNHLIAALVATMDDDDIGSQPIDAWVIPPSSSRVRRS